MSEEVVSSDAIPVTIRRKEVQYGNRKFSAVTVKIPAEWIEALMINKEAVSFEMESGFNFQTKESEERITGATFDTKGRRVFRNKFIGVVKFTPRGNGATLA